MKKHKYFIELTAYNTNPGQSNVWFQRGKPTIHPDFSRHASSGKEFRTLKKARQMARGIVDHFPGCWVQIICYCRANKYSLWNAHGETWRARS